MKLSRLVLLAVFVLLAPVSRVSAAQGYSLIVAPDRYSVMQVCFDMVNTVPAVLASYQGQADTQDPTIYVWNGSEWVFVSLKDYREVNFLQQMPSRIVLVGDDRTLPAVLVEASSWAPKVDRITQLSNAALVNDFGRLFDFKSRDWAWFSKRYNLQLTDESEPLRNSSWYDQRGPIKRPPLKEIIGETSGSLSQPAVYEEPVMVQETVNPSIVVVDPVPAEAVPEQPAYVEDAPAPVTDAPAP